MSPAQKEFLGLRRWPLVLDLTQLSHMSGFLEHELNILLARGHLKSAGSPPRNGKRVFITADMEQLMTPQWIAKARRIIIDYWADKNGKSGASSDAAA